MSRSKLRRAIATCLTATLTVGVITTGTFAKASDEEDLSKYYRPVTADSLGVTVDFYDYNIREYKGKELDETTKVAINAYALEKITSGTSITADQVFLFGGDRKKENAGTHNVWTGMRKGQYQGIVEDRLSPSGDLVFNNEEGIYGLNIFPSKGDTELEDAGVLKSYYDTGFQFYDEDGTYVYDSNQHATYNLGNGTIQSDFTRKGPTFVSGTGSEKNVNGFFPFNTVAEGDTTLSAQEDRHHMFGMKLQLEFFMVQNGRVATESDPSNYDKDMIFQFQGDDDVWVFIDGKLALDLGGIHDTVAGSINFATGDVEYQKDNTSSMDYKVKNIYSQLGIDQTEGSKHTLTMFYLERGEYDSNCKITFNLPKELPTVTPFVTTTPGITATPKVSTAPAVTASPDVTETPKVTSTPEVSKTPEATSTPEISKTPEVTSTPEVSKTPEVTSIPKVTETPKVTKTPVVSSTPRVTKVPVTIPTPKTTATPRPVISATPKVTDTPIIVPTPEIPSSFPTPVPTETPKVTATPEISDKVESTVKPGEVDTQKTEEPVIVEEPTLMPGGAPDITPMVTLKPEETTIETTEEPVENIPEEELPNSGTKTKKKETPKPEKKVDPDGETIVVDDVPSSLPQTGGIGQFLQENKKNGSILLFIPVFVIAAGTGIVVRKRKKRETE